MLISLQINTVDALPANMPTGYAARDRSFRIGREACDWTLPDPDKFISGRHCEVRYEGGAFWLHDVSRNGTYINGSRQRMAAPHRLEHGDRVLIGRHVIFVAIDDERDKAGRAGQGSTRGDTLAAGRSREFSDEALPRSGQGVQASTAPSQPRASTRDDVLREIAMGTGMSPDLFQSRDPHELAGEIGGVLRTVVEQLSLLLKARAAAKMLARSTQRTMIGAADNNPLKFVPGTDDILEIMFARRRAGYLDAKRSIEDAFGDLKTHEFATYAAMQSALSRLLDDLSPEAIGKKLPPSSFSSKKSQAWDAFVATWRTMEEAHDNGMLDIFLAYFNEAYAKAEKRK